MTNINNRQEANFEILAILTQIVKHNPHLRFQQILTNYKIYEVEKDKFYEESTKTLENLEKEINRGYLMS